jgi:hypothetical protein
MIRRIAAAVVLCFVATVTFAAEPPQLDPTIADAARVAELEKTLSHAALVGHFTVTGDQGQSGDTSKLTTERYELGEVKHLGSNQWLLPATIKYGDHNVTVPLTLPIRWAGDTPMICVDELPIPGLGTFTARVMIRSNAAKKKTPPNYRSLINHLAPGQ